MAQFMLLLYNDPSGWSKLSPEDMQKATEKYMAWTKKPSRSGKSTDREPSG